MRRHLGELEQLLLFALAHLGPQAYGASIAALIETRTGRAISPGAIYTALDRLERRGFVRSAWGEPTPERGGKRKRHYQLQAAGAAALHRSRTALAAMAQGLRAKPEPR